MREQLLAQPELATDELRRRLALEDGPPHADPGVLRRPSAPLFDALAQSYEQHFAAPHRRAYDLLAWEICRRWLPASPARVVDVGCGTARWSADLLAAGYQVTGLEPASRMAERALQRVHGDSDFALVTKRVEDAVLPDGFADAVLAMGSLQYTEDPAASIAFIARWLKPGGVACVLVDSKTALVLELLRAGRPAEAAERERTGIGVWTEAGHTADLHLLTASGVRRYCADAGLHVLATHGLLVGASVVGRTQLNVRLEQDFDRQLDEEREWASRPEFADLGKQILVVARAPSNGSASGDV